MSNKTIVPAISILSFSLLASFTGHANESLDKNQSTIFVTATRTSSTVDETLFPVTIITKEDIQRLNPKSINDILRTLPGISYSSFGGMGKDSSISLRGTSTNHVLFLIDGIPLRSATSGSTSFQYIPISQIERIEIVRGARSSLYGSHAIGGVIQIFTKNNHPDNGHNGELSVGYGSNNTRDLNGSFNYSNNKSNISLGLSSLETDGDDILGETEHGVTYKNTKDNDPYSNYSLSLNAKHKFTEQLNLSLNFLNAKGKTKYDGINNTSKTGTHFNEQVIGLNLNYDWNDTFKTKVLVSSSIDNQTNFSPDSVFDTQTDLLNLQNELALNDNNLVTFGLDYKVDQVTSSTSFTLKDRWNSALYGQYQHFNDLFDIQFSLRHDKNESFGTHDTWSVGAGTNLTNTIRLTSSYGTAFKAPTFNDLYFPFTDYGWGFTYQGNTNLKPEKSKTFDIGLNFKVKNSSIQFNYFKTNIDDLITTTSNFSTVENISTSEIEGIELSMSTTWSNWLLSADYTFSNPVNSITGHQLKHKSTQVFNLSLDHHYGRLNYGASLLLSSGRYNKNNEVDYLAGYSLVNLRTTFNIDQQWKLNAKVDNVFNQKYSLIQDLNGHDYNQPGRFVMVSVGYSY